MPLRCLLFSSDEQASRLLIQALKELELEIEPCPEIFGAVEALARRSLAVVLADLDAGPEANFLLKNARELKLNKDIVVVAVASEATKAAAGETGAEVVLTKPIVVDQVKYGLLCCDRFLASLGSQRIKSAAATRDTAPPPTLNEPPKVQPAGWSGISVPAVPVPSPSPTPFPIPQRAAVESVAPPNPTGPVIARRPRPNLPAGTLPRGITANRPVDAKRDHTKLLRTVTFVVFSLGLAYGVAASRNPRVTARVTGTYRRVLEKAHAKVSEIARDWRQNPKDDIARNSVGSNQAVQAATFQIPASFEPSMARVRAIPAHRQSVPGPTPAVIAGGPTVERQTGQVQTPVAMPLPEIPESIRRPQPEAESVRIVTSKLTLLGELQPVSLSAEASEQLLLEEVQPRYPDQALKAGLQGDVVLQAWIGTDGNIRDLKLVKGPLLLGRAAYQAVKQWRYKPYFRSGKAMEALTYVTVTFTLPRQSMVSPANQ